MSTAGTLRMAHASGLVAVERELADLHRATLRVGGEGSRMLRLSVLNLVVACTDERLMDRAGEVAERIAAEHPARTIIVLADPDREPGIEADLRLQCTVVGGSDQVCSETVRIHVGGEARFHLGSVVTPLLLPDVPTRVWLLGAPPLTQALAAETLALAGNIVLTSDQYTGRRATLQALAALPAAPDGSIPVIDLSWLRLEPWRELVARAFDAPGRRPFLAGIERVAITALEAIPGDPSTAALLIDGWFRSRLAAVGLAAPRAEIVPTGEAEGDHLNAIEIHARSGHSELILRIDEPDGSLRTRVEIDGRVVAARTVPREHTSLADLVGAALQCVDADPVYADAVRAVAE